MMLSQILHNTEKYTAIHKKGDRKIIGQFFTPLSIALYMGDLGHIKDDISILEPGAGNGLLTAVLVKTLAEKGCHCISAFFVENDSNVIPLLEDSIKLMQAFCQEKGIIFDSTVIQDNFILNNAIDRKFDIVISNPPYKKIPKNAPESIRMSRYVHGQPNLYSLFMAKGMDLLKNGGQYIYITPRSWTSGAYYKLIRRHLIDSDIQTIHVFKDRDNVFTGEQVLQETMIISGQKGVSQQKYINVSVSGGDNLDSTAPILVDAKALKGEAPEYYLVIPTSEKEVGVLKKMRQIPDTFDSLGYIFRTGPVVEFRNRDMISKEPRKGLLPMYRTANIINGRFTFPAIADKPQYISEKAGNLLLKNRNTVLVRRLTAKEENRRLQSCVYYPQYGCDYISIENHVNYLERKDGTPLSKYEVDSIQKALSSEEYDIYYRLLNGSTQVNAGELNLLPLRKEMIV